MAPKKKKVDEVLILPPPPEPEEVEEEQEEVQYTETSYTSASFEVLPEPPPDETSKKKKKKKVEAVVKKASSDLMQWSDESFVEPIEPEKEEEVAPLSKEKKPKPKKSKKKEEPVEIIPVFDKPKNWKKMNKKEQDKWMVDRIAQWRLDVEAEKQAKIAGAKEKRAAQARERAEKLVRDNAEQEIRRDILQKTCVLLSRFERQKRNYDNNKQMKEEWAQYLRCDGLPDPRVVTQMATYLHVWRERGLYNDVELERRCAEALPMLGMLEEIVANSRQYTERQARNYNEVRMQLREQLAYTIDFASYWLLRDMERRLNNESVMLASYGKSFRSLKLNLWCVVKMPTKLKLPPELASEPEPITLAFPAINVKVKLPNILDTSALCVRASRSMVDLLSERSRSFVLAHEIANRFEDFFIFNVKEHMEMLSVKKDQDVVRNAFFKQLRERTRELEKLLKANVYGNVDKEKEELEQLYLAEPPYMPEPRDCIAEQNEKTFRQYLKSVNVKVRPGEINLRKYRICGGVLNIDLLTSPPQPKRMKYELELTTLELPKELKPVDYKVQYRTPRIYKPGEKTEWQCDEQMRQIQAEYEKLALVTIQLPQDVIWSEPPIVCQWQHPKNLWTSNYVNDYNYNRLTLDVTFRTGVLWPIGIAVLKYGNMPYRGWEMKPDPNGKGVIVNVSGQQLNITILCVTNGVKLQFVANSYTPALKEHFNKRYSVKKLVQLMRDAACDFFPEFDAHNYVEGTCTKEWVMERHTYHAMAMLSRTYNFQWSRCNALVGSRNIIFQLREAIDPKRESKFNLAHVTPQRTVLLKYNEKTMPVVEIVEPEVPPEVPLEVPPELVCLDPMTGIAFYPDLFTFNLRFGSADARRQSFAMSYKPVETVFSLLQELKLCSFS